MIFYVRQNAGDALIFDASAAEDSAAGHTTETKTEK